MLVSELEKKAGSSESSSLYLQFLDLQATCVTMPRLEQEL